MFAIFNFGADVDVHHHGFVKLIGCTSRDDGSNHRLGRSINDGKGRDTWDAAGIVIFQLASYDITRKVVHVARLRR